LKFRHTGYGLGSARDEAAFVFFLLWALSALEMLYFWWLRAPALHASHGCRTVPSCRDA
jgi:hypothetical protein